MAKLHIPKVNSKILTLLMKLLEADTPAQARRALSGVYGARKGTADMLRNLRASGGSALPNKAIKRTIDHELTMGAVQGVVGLPG